MVEVLEQYYDQDFCFIAEVSCEEGICFQFEPQHGTILILKGLVEEDENAVFPFGIPDKKKMSSARIAFWEPFSAIYPDGRYNERGIS